MLGKDYALEWSMCSYSNTEQQYSSTVHKTQNKRWFQTSGSTGAGSWVVPVLCKAYIGKIAVMII